MKLIGTGSFTKAYDTNDGKVLLKSIDPIKECMAMGWFPESRLFPTIDRIDLNVYTMDNLGKTPKGLAKTLRPRQYRLYKHLRELFCDNCLRDPSMRDGFTKWHILFESLPSEFKREKEILRGALDAIGNYGLDICFEISPRNVRIKNGFLILLDCFFLKSELFKTLKRA